MLSLSAREPTAVLLLVVAAAVESLPWSARDPTAVLLKESVLLKSAARPTAVLWRPMPSPLESLEKSAEAPTAVFPPGSRRGLVDLDLVAHSRIGGGRLN
jgi:hypothetical protein